MAEWKPIPDLPGYEVSDDGQVRFLGGIRNFGSQKRYVPPCSRKPQRHTGGYQQLPICGRTYYVHRLVGAAFVPQRDGCPDINHINGDKTDNRAVNLEWVTRKENIRHSVDVLGNGVRERHPSAKLTPDQVRAIRVDVRSSTEIAAEYNVTPSNITAIRRRKSWSTLP